MEWFEQLADCFAWFVPAIALLGVLIAICARCTSQKLLAESVYFVLLLIAGCSTLRTILADDRCYFLHLVSLGVMIVGALLASLYDTAAVNSTEG
jgi:hypothetical protein